MYWLSAVGALALALWIVKPVWGKALGVLIMIGAFGYLPLQELIEASKREAYARKAWVYFKKKCETEAGEKIYKTYANVKSVLVVKPLPPATEKDLYDQFWYGDPYSASAHSQRGRLEAAILASPDAPVAYDQLGRGFDFVELTRGSSNEFIQLYYPMKMREHISQGIDRSVSRFGISWEDISTPEDRKYWVAGSRLQVIDLTDNSIVAERVGYLIEAGFGSEAGQRRPWLTSRGPNTTCPAIRNGNFEDRWFILKVLKPAEGAENGKRK
ncbi:MAG: hypothetical protein ACREUW_06995 [Burkholderiales bacterium]